MPMMNPNDPLNFLNQEIIDEMISNDPAKAYLTLKTKIGQIDLQLNETTGWFWKAPKATPMEQIQLRAMRELCMVGLSQVVNTLNSMASDSEVKFTTEI